MASSWRRAPRWRSGHRRSGRPGQSLLELALILPLLTLVIVGSVSLGLHLYAQLIVTTAAQDGARVASSEGRSLTEGRQIAQRWLDRQLGDWARDLTVVARCDPPQPPAQELCLTPTVTLSITGSLPIHLPPLLTVNAPVAIAVTMHREAAIDDR